MTLYAAKDGHDLNELTVVELKARLKAKGLIVSGLKKDLIERLSSSSNEETSTNLSSVDNAKEDISVPIVASKKVVKQDTTRQVQPPIIKVVKHPPKHEANDEDDFLAQLMAEGDEILREDRNRDSTSSSSSMKSTITTSTSSSSSSSSPSSSRRSSGSVNVEEIQRLCDQRNELRYHRDYDGADAIRDQLENVHGLKIFDFKNEWVSTTSIPSIPPSPSRYVPCMLTLTSCFCCYDG